MGNELNDQEMYSFIATMAMSALMTQYENPIQITNDLQKIAKRAVLMADALLIELDKRHPSHE